ncbi:MAG: hypothetical protein IPJ61_18840 [Tessaracoccus sp.]|uniref:hypothetical protein n=1 Tax=Tessaracoccus sp. TaxID=1971211 RepID=UPI001EC87EDD|nr:hypothetical protein [Tessaracoccus sp.]MBK7823043.1 hypothetical protein [Tessaracoccus sp.]
MGRLAQTFAGLQIMDMFPYNMPTEQTFTTGQTGIAFPNADLMNQEGMPFAVHRVIPRVSALDSSGLLLATQPDVNVAEALIKLAVLWQGFNQNGTKAPTRISNLVGGSTSERYWRLEEPIVLPNANGVVLTGSCDTFPASFAGSGIISLRVTLVLQGFFLQVAPPRG